MAAERMIIWSGISQLDGVTPIVALATGVPKAPRFRKDGTPIVSRAKSSANEKTGNMIQIHIVVDGDLPLDVLKQGRDEAICGTCPHRGKASGGTGACYVNLGKGQNSMMRSHMNKGSVPFDVSRFAGQKVRLGAYGDPAAVPFEIWQSIAAVAEGVTGYTHQWRTADPRLAQVCMASADSMPEYLEARRAGYKKAFLVLPEGSARPKGFISCPASAEAGKKTVCASCMRCGGESDARKHSIMILAHGATKKQFAPA
jgi:hypothetical protein